MQCSIDARPVSDGRGEHDDQDRTIASLLAGGMFMAVFNPP